MVESFFSIKYFKTVMVSFFNIKKFKTHKKVMESFFQSFLFTFNYPDVTINYF